MRVLICICALIFGISCQDAKVKQETKKVAIGKFNVDSTYSFLQKQVDFGNRYMNTKEHELCKDWLVDKFASYGFEIIEQKFKAKLYYGEEADGTNVIARYNPNVLERVLLCAHYDTRHIAEKDSVAPTTPILGADDGGSGVAVLIEIARQLSLNPIPMGVDIVLFDAEDSGANESGNDYTWGLGSQYWSKNLHESPYDVKYGILLDMVGAKNATFPKEGFSRKTAGPKLNAIWSFANKMGYGKYFVNRNVGSYTDDHRFIVENTSIPMIDIINIKEDGKFGAHHHTHNDDMEIISKETLNAVGKIILAVVYKESNKENF